MEYLHWTGRNSFEIGLSNNEKISHNNWHITLCITLWLFLAYVFTIKLPCKLCDYYLRHTAWHKFQNKLWIGNVAASALILTDFQAHSRVRARNLIYSTISYEEIKFSKDIYIAQLIRMSHCIPEATLKTNTF